MARNQYVEVSQLMHMIGACCRSYCEAEMVRSSLQRANAAGQNLLLSKLEDNHGWSIDVLRKRQVCSPSRSCT